MAAEEAEADVLIVGMGPTGVALAGLLGQRGVRTVVFDKLEGVNPLPRAVGMDHEVMRIAQELGVADELRDYVAPYRPSEYRGVNDEVIKRFDSPPPPHRLGWPALLVFEQPAFEAALRARVGELSPVTVRLGTNVTAFGQDEASAWVDVDPGTESARCRVRGRYLVACDGASSPIRRELGVPMADLGFHEPWLVIDMIVEDDAALARLPDCNVQYCQPRRPGTYVNLVGRHRRWEISLDPGELAAGPVDHESVWPWLERWIRPGEATVWRAAAYMFHGLVAEQWRYGRILLAGDAAHMTPPFMAQGMAQGMRDAQNLAWKLHAVVSGRASERLLDTYEVERRPHVVATTGLTIELGRVIGERDESIALERDRQMLAGHEDGVPVTLRSTLLPGLGAGLVHPESPGSGEILPQPHVITAVGEVLLDDLAGTGFRILVCPAVTTEELARLTAAMAPLGGSVTTIRRNEAGDESVGLVDRDGQLTDWLSRLGRTIVIARPDHYVYGTARSVDEAVALVCELAAAQVGVNEGSPEPSPASNA